MCKPQHVDGESIVLEAKPHDSRTSKKQLYKKRPLTHVARIYEVKYVARIYEVCMWPGYKSLYVARIYEVKYVARIYEVCMWPGYKR